MSNNQELITKTILDTYLSAELNALKTPAGWFGSLDETVAEFTTSSTSFGAVSASFLTATITTGGGDVLVGFTGTCRASGNLVAYFDILLDGVQVGGEDGLVAQNVATSTENNISLVARIGAGALSAGSHSFALAYKTSANTLTLRAGFSASQVHSIYWGVEL